MKTRIHSSLKSIMPRPMRWVAALLALPLLASAQTREFDVEILVDGLNAPVGIAAQWSHALYFSEVPTPGLFGTDGGMNTVKRLSLRSKEITTISEGEPYPINIALDTRGSVYWTCQTAGVILKYNRRDGKTFFLPADPENDPFLNKPNGITVDRRGDVLFTELPNPGTVGDNMVSVSDGNNITVISNNEPAPTDIVIGWDGTAYWTCNTAGVIIKRSRAGVISILLDGIESPTGIALDVRGRRLYYTDLPTPGVSGDEGGRNTVNEVDLRTLKTTVVAAGFPQPTDVTVTYNGRIYWTCTKAGVIACATPKPVKKPVRYKKY